MILALALLLALLCRWAGPLPNGRARYTHLDWTVAARELDDRSGLVTTRAAAQAHIAVNEALGWSDWHQLCADADALVERADAGRRASLLLADLTRRRYDVTVGTARGVYEKLYAPCNA